MKKIICIYRIVNIITGDFYIGQTIDFYQRVVGHMSSPPPKMREDVEIYGWDAFKFEPIHICTREELTPLENHYIKTLKPEYNTRYEGYKRPEEVCKKISEAKMGHDTDPESCVKMSEKRLRKSLAEDHVEILRQKSMGNKSRSTPVLCVETGIVYPSIKAAATDVGISPSAISSVLRGITVTAGKYHWRLVGVEENRGSQHRNIPVIDEDTGIIYDNIDAAAEDLGISATTISRIARGETISKLHFRFLKPPTYNEIRTVDKRFGNGGLDRSIIVCEETGEEFFGVKIIENKLGIPTQEVLDALEEKVETAGGLHFRYTGKRLSRDVKPKIRCLENNMIFDNINDVAAFVKRSPRTVANHLRGYKKSVGSFHLEYVIEKETETEIEGELKNESENK